MSIMIEIAWAAVKKKGSYCRDKYWRLRYRLGLKRPLSPLPIELSRCMPVLSMVSVIRNWERISGPTSNVKKLVKIRKEAKALGYDLFAIAVA
jgi:hypothetical protein